MEKFIVINSGQNLEDKLYRVGKKTSLTFKPGPKCVALNVSLLTNYPLKKGSKFSRTQYHELSIEADHQDLISSSFNWRATIVLDTAGTFHFKSPELEWQAYVIVNPEVKVPLESIKCLTVLTKNLGEFKEWRQRLNLAKDLKYNMVHFTPIQELGASKSAYSLRNQLKVNPSFKTTLDDIKKEVDYMEKKCGILSITDIVLNHTSDDSPWVQEHPECTYNLANSPHLRPAFLLDSAFIWLTQDLTAGILAKTDNLTPIIESEKDVQKIGVLLKTFYVPLLKIHELFTINIEETVARFNDLPRGPFKVDYGRYERNNARVLSIPDDVSTVEQLRKYLEHVNRHKLDEIRGYLLVGIENALNGLRYERLNPNGPYYGMPVGPNCPIVAPYFKHSPFSQFKISTEEALMYRSGHMFMAHNGWVMGSVHDFAGPGSNVFLKRELIAWGDCVKLRYGSDTPYLWEHMKKYVEAQAKVFHGFRIDNCHSTPLEVAEFMVDTARNVRPDIFIMAELFTSSEAVDNIYVNRLGITSLVRESMNAHEPRELGRLIYRFGGTPVGAFFNHGAEQLMPGVASAIFYDQTHDNESPIVRRSAHDVPATTSLVNMAICATGSTRGHDELVPHHINVVTENRLYPIKVNENGGILPLRRMLNGPLQRELSQGFTEIFVDQVNDEIIAVTRHNPVDGRSIVLIARTAFSKDFPKMGPIRSINIEGVIKSIIFEAVASGDPTVYTRDDHFINGLQSFHVEVKSRPNQSELAHIQSNSGSVQVNLDESKFLPSAVLAVEVALDPIQSKALDMLNNWQVDLTGKGSVSLSDANYILFRCAREDGIEPYGLPNYCSFTYSGLYGLMYYLEKVRDNQDQAHPLAMNLRQGNWLSQYIVGRLRRRKNLEAFADHLESALKQVDLLPRGMVPKYFDLVITKTYKAVVDLIYSKMSHFVCKGPSLVKLLALASTALIGDCDTAPMPKVKGYHAPSIAAGLPHFASEYLRNWGRDTFIALRGVLLVTGRFEDAKAVILSYAKTLKRGLIPNLLDGGVKPRYNCRDAVWWWLYTIKEYTKMAPNGTEILRLLNDSIQEALDTHFKGIEFVEDNAGVQLDEHMKDEGFRIKIGVDRETGFVYGGNKYNCGTWMDKMGSSVKAKNKGLPSSPRDGSAVEIVGLSKAVVTWLDEMFKNGRYPYDGVECMYDNTIKLKWTWKKWAAMIQSNFEKYFYIPLENEKPVIEDPNAKYINRRGIYKDTHGASIEWQDYQLRPNFLVAMVVAPELFNKDHAKYVLKITKENLCGPLGMKTLDPSDWNYRGDYDNSNDTTDIKVAHGFNYHQGPEWLWLTGYYIRASSKFLGSTERLHHLQILSNFYSTLVETPWLGLPELTNSNGKVCHDSCSIQAWSLGSALEALYESIRG